MLCRPGSDLLSQVLRHSTIGAEEFNGRVRDGIGFGLLARATRPAKHRVCKNGWPKVLIGWSFRRGLLAFGRAGGWLCHRLALAWGFFGLVATTGMAGRGMGMMDENDQAGRAISTGKLNALLRLHTRPINVVVFHGSSGRTRFEVGFPLRCLQRLSRPYIATLHCGWRHNRSTRGTSTPVLSY